MADETYDKKSDDNPTKLRIAVAALVVISVLTFLAGFLQDTKYNFVNYIFFFLLFLGGIGLMSATKKSTQARTTKGFLFLTGIATTLLLVFYIAYESFRLRGQGDLAASIEALLYGLSLLFCIGVIGSLVLVRRRS